jgi:hypothetical protein
MSVPLLLAAYEAELSQGRLSEATLLAVLVRLAWRATDDGLVPDGAPAIARATRLRLRTVREALAWLEAAGLIAKVELGRKRPGHLTKYRVTLATPGSAQRDSNGCTARTRAPRAPVHHDPNTSAPRAVRGERGALDQTIDRETLARVRARDEDARAERALPPGDDVARIRSEIRRRVKPGLYANRFSEDVGASFNVAGDVVVVGVRDEAIRKKIETESRVVLERAVERALGRKIRVEITLSASPQVKPQGSTPWTSSKTPSPQPT